MAENQEAGRVAASGETGSTSLRSPEPCGLGPTGNDPARVLDVCCGSRMFWFDKNDARALFVDKRREVCADPRGREIVVDPDIIGDFTSLPFQSDSFSLVVFDPPHTFNGAGSAMAKKYGRLEPGWREQITHGFAECFRVLDAGGTLIFKWNEHRVPVKTVLAMTPEKPLFGHRSGRAAKTHWIVFMKPRDSDAAPRSPEGAEAEGQQRGPQSGIAQPPQGLNPYPPFHSENVFDG